ncbi:MAG: histidine kinase [Arcicella sp.]|jgi:two-component system, LytTR family, sensor kinase|nr:histidine kinase [Arcicella sp.]
MFSTPYRYLFIVLLAAYSLLNTWSVEIFEHYPIDVTYGELLVIFLLLTLGIWEGNRLLNNYLQTKKYHHLWKQLATTFGGSIIITTLITLTLGLLAAYFILPFAVNTLLLPMKLLMMFAFRINLFLNVLNIIYWYVNQLEKTQIEAEKFKKISTQAQLQAVKNQINPHFLFNNLSVLSALIPLDTTASVEFVKQFSKVYRYVLQNHDKELIELSTELDFINAYLYLLKQRFGESLDININIPQDCQQDYIIPLALQMLVENAVKHNIVSKNKPLQINIYTEGMSTLVVQNNLQRKVVNDVESNQLGLANIAQRYDFLGQKSIDIQEINNFFIVKFPIIKLNTERNMVKGERSSVNGKVAHV